MLVVTVASLLAPRVGSAQGVAPASTSASTPASSATAAPAPAPGPTSPPTKDQCADSYEAAQRLRKAYKLRAAHEQLVVCAAASCPAFMTQDCAKWLGEVEANTPTVVLLAHGADGSALVDVHVTMDGEPLTDRLDGRAIAVDPGAHQMHYETAGRTLDERIVVAEGARNQQVVADLGRLTGRLAPRSEPPSGVPAGPPRPIPTATWVLGGAAAIAAVSFAAFAIAGRSVQSCAPECTRPQVDDLRRDYLVADVSWIAALVAAGAALVVYLAAPSAPPAPAAAALRW
jgi:hypothetical protein